MCLHSWYRDHDDRWTCYDCPIELSDEAVNLLRAQGQVIEIDYDRLTRELHGEQEGQP